MREYRLTCDKFEYISILDVRARKAAGEHAVFNVKGHIGADTDEYVLRSMAGQGVEFTAESDDGDKKLFNGIIEDIGIRVENEMRILTVNVVSRTTLMDIEPKIRTFQDSGMTYGMVTNHMEETGGMGNFLWPSSGDTPIGSMTVQYKETDWQYAGRLASRLGKVIIPDYLLDEPYVSMGMTKRAAHEGLEVMSYELKKAVKRFRDAQSPDFSERDAIYYVVKSREILDLCDPVPFLGTMLYVYAIDTAYEGEQLVHYYTLKEESGFYARRYFNEDLNGVSLTGAVAAVKADMVRIRISGDVEQTNHKWFSYATPFSQPGGQGWYFMPEPGDEVRLMFPSEQEDDAYVSSAVHITHGSRTNPNVKFIRTIHGQIIKFDPTHIMIDDGAGSSISFHKEQGLSMTTDKVINIEAQSDVILSASGKVEISGQGGVVTQKGESAINVEDSVDISSEHTREQ